ncbi:MAG: F0F1 ATP synthase subunit A [Alphaproteobacteria bacterium]|jgi:F-type H+-transporting ATPase subunit a|nr:F0F1 ATP synthase subunit A [Alphaproteobacteria bacterium]MBT5390648.1 F0F1 ATP synthase subunit A [Alphaproteobacteria bacterium]MBT5540256.1 F0F1 ATP synthase subunit A [Alphaproteobacteria bacterium]MBT5654080.1 F0F1 ATP synthase subunit A [Alphaproteobacteria bacterium]
MTIASPLHQFELVPIVSLKMGNVDLSFTNSSFFMILSTFLISVFLILSMQKKAIIPGRWQSLAEVSYEFIANMARENIGLDGRKYFPFVFSLFMFLLFGNMLGMIPYSYTFTSQIIVTFGLAMMVFVLVTLIGIAKHGLRFLLFFVPKGVPVFLLPLIIPIEIISYLSRPVSLSVRLFANMMAGHTMLKVFAGFTVMLGVYGIAPLAINVALTAFEIMVAALQAYVFTILTCLYLNDALHLH